MCACACESGRLRYRVEEELRPIVEEVERRRHGGTTSNDRRTNSGTTELDRGRRLDRVTQDEQGREQPLS